MVPDHLVDGTRDRGTLSPTRMSESDPESPADGALCPHAETCAMYPLLAMSGTLDVWRSKYCNKDYKNCERYKRQARGAPVPAQLMPNGVMLRPGGS